MWRGQHLRWRGQHPRWRGGPPSRDELDMERELNAKRAQILQHCDVAMFHAVVATALRWWAIVLKSDLRSRAPLRLWREALLILALEFELPGYAPPSSSRATQSASARPWRSCVLAEPRASLPPEAPRVSPQPRWWPAASVVGARGERVRACLTKVIMRLLRTPYIRRSCLGHIRRRPRRSAVVMAR